MAPSKRFQRQPTNYENIVKGASSPLTEDNLILLDQCPVQDPYTQDSDVNNVLRAEQTNKFNRQQGMMQLRLDEDDDNYQNWPKPPSSFQSSASVSGQYCRGDPQPHSLDKSSSPGQRTHIPRPSHYKPSSSGQKDKGQLDNLKLYAQLSRGSNDDPRMRHLSPGAPADPPVFAKQALSDSKMPYGEGWSAENRRLIGKYNAEQSARRKEPHCREWEEEEWSLRDSRLV